MYITYDFDDFLFNLLVTSNNIIPYHHKLFDEFLDQFFIKTWLKKKLIDMFNYNDGEGGKWRRDM